MIKNFLYNSKNIQYRVSGNGSLVVLLHGFGEDGNIWRNQVDELSAYKLIIPDLPGSGGSEMIEDMSMEGLAECIKALIEVEEKESKTKPVLIGHSMGGYIALAFAEKYECMLTGLGLFHSTAYADNAEKREMRKKGIDFMKKHGSFEFLKTAIPNLYFNVDNSDVKKKIDQHLSSVYNFSVDALVSYYENMIVRTERTDILKTCNVPVLFIQGRHDKAVPLSDGMQLCFLPQLSYIHILEKSAHMGMIEQTPETNKILLEYLKDLST